MQVFRVVGFLQLLHLHESRFKQVAQRFMVLYPEIFTYDVAGQCLPVTSFFLNYGVSADGVIGMVITCPYVLQQPIYEVRAFLQGLLLLRRG